MLTLPISYAALGEMLSRVHIGLLVTDPRGRVEHTNASLMRTLTTDPERARVETALRGAVLRLIDADEPSPLDRYATMVEAPTIEVKTVRASYRVCASRLGARISVMVSMAAASRPAPALPSAALLVERFGLTPREADVAELLARGCSNLQVAESLAISPFTARRHTERVLMKLSARSRAEVSAVLLGLAPRSGSQERAG
jgi:DNA-binding CsgD family transcriptional regulator